MEAAIFHAPLAPPGTSIEGSFLCLKGLKYFSHVRIQGTYSPRKTSGVLPMGITTLGRDECDLPIRCRSSSPFGKNVRELDLRAVEVEFMHYLSSYEDVLEGLDMDQPMKSCDSSPTFATSWLSAEISDSLLMYLRHLQHQKQFLSILAGRETCHSLLTSVCCIVGNRAPIPVP